MFSFVYDFDGNAYELKTTWHDILNYYYENNDKDMFNSLARVVYRNINKNNPKNAELLDKLGIKSEQDITNLPLQPNIISNDEGTETKVSTGWLLTDIGDDIASKLLGEDFIKKVAEPMAYEDYSNNFFA